MNPNEPCPMCNHVPHGLKVGDTLYGYCHGTFGDSYGEKRVEYIGIAGSQPYVVVSERGFLRYTDEDISTIVRLYRGNPDDLCEYRMPPPEEDY